MGIKTAPLSALAGAVALAVALALPARAADTAPVSVPTVAAQAGAAAAGFELDGTLQAIRQATVAAQVGGNVLALAVKAGDRVKAGQLLARIDDRDAAAGLLRGDAGVAQAEAELRNAKVNAERQAELRRQGFVSQAALDVADTQLKAATAGLQQAQAGRSQAALARGFATVAAPFDALVLATHVEAGDLAAPGRPVATLYVPGALRAVVQVPASRAALAQGASKIEVRLPDGRIVTPQRQQALPGADPVSQTVEWRLDLPANLDAGATAALMPGQSVAVRFVGTPAPAAAASNRLTLPAAAVLRRGELTAVYVARENQFQLRAVRAGASVGGQVEVLAGLQPGERVAADAVKAGLAGAVPSR